MRKIDEIIVHCTATRSDFMSDHSTAAKVKEVTRWHLDRGFSQCGYHYLIDRDGTVAEARPVEKAGAHAKGHNAHSIGISLFGGHGGDQDDKFAENFTPEQDRALRRLIAQLRMEYPAIKTIRGHNEVSAKMCPCFHQDCAEQDNPSFFCCEGGVCRYAPCWCCRWVAVAELSNHGRTGSGGNGGSGGD